MNYISNFSNNTPIVYTPLPIIKNNSSSDKYVTWLDAVDIGNINEFGLDLTTFGSYNTWHNKTINNWATFFECIETHFRALQAKIDELNGMLSQVSSIMWENASALSYAASSSEPNIINSRTIKVTFASGSSSTGQKATSIVAKNESNGTTVSQWYNTAGRYKLYGVYQGKETTNYITCEIIQQTQQLTIITAGNNQYTTNQGVNASWKINGTNSFSGSASDKFNITGSGTTATVSHKSWPTLTGTMSIYVNNSSSATITAGQSVTIKVKYTPKSETYTAYIFASASGYSNSNGYTHSETNTETSIPSSVTLTGLSGATVSLNSSTHEGTVTINPTQTGTVGISGYSNASVAITVQQAAQPYYFYVGLTKPTSSTTIGTPVTGQQMGWHLIGDSIDGYSVASPVYAGSVPSQTINVNPDYDDVDFYAAVPVGLSLHDGLGNIIDSLFLDTANVTINGHSYNIFKIYNSDFLATIY